MNIIQRIETAEQVVLDLYKELEGLLKPYEIEEGVWQSGDKKVIFFEKTYPEDSHELLFNNNEQPIPVEDDYLIHVYKHLDL